MPEYECPNCGFDVIVDGLQETVICTSCYAPLYVDYDAEFVDGLWKDLTKLYIS